MTPILGHVFIDSDLVNDVAVLYYMSCNKHIFLLAPNDNLSVYPVTVRGTMTHSLYLRDSIRGSFDYTVNRVLLGPPDTETYHSILAFTRYHNWDLSFHKCFHVKQALSSCSYRGKILSILERDESSDYEKEKRWRCFLLPSEYVKDKSEQFCTWHFLISKQC